MKIFYLPDLGEGLPEAEIREWLVNEGDEIQIDHPMVSMETAKAVVEVPAPRSGRILKLYGKSGELVSTGAPLVEFEDGDENTSATVAGSLEVSNLVLEENATGVKPIRTFATPIKALPAVRALAKSLNIDLSIVTPTGTNQQITIEDVKRATRSTQATPLEGYEALHSIRRTMALGMVQSHREVVSVTLVDDAILNHKTLETDITLGIIHAILAGCKAEPALNAWFDGNTLSKRLWDEVHLGLAMDSAEGLFVPVLKDVGHTPPQVIRENINRFKEQVKHRIIATEEMRGATFVLSNFGMFAGRYANPIIMPPTVAILGTGRLREQPTVNNGQMVIQKVLPLSLSFDHRAITGGEASRFLAAVIKKLAEE